MTRLIRAWVSPSSCTSVPLPAANDARSASTSSIWAIAARMPSTMPMATSFSSSSREAKWVVVVMRDPASVGSKVNSIRMVGSSVFGLPSSSAKPSSTSKLLPSSTARNSQ